MFFILTCMFVNGFVSNIDVNRYSFVMMFVSISKNASIQFLNKCGGSMLAVSSKVCVDVLNTILPSKDKMPPADNSKKENKREHKAANNDYAIVENVFKLSDKRVKICEAGGNFLYPADLFEISNAYGRHVFYDTISRLIIILFIIFIVSIRQRKGREIAESILINNNLMQKKRVSA